MFREFVQEFERGRTMRTFMKALGLAAATMLCATSAVAAPSLEITKPPVTPVPSWTGPQTPQANDPHAEQGQWFIDLGTEEEHVRTHEFYDNHEQAGGGSSSTLAIEGVVDAASITFNALHNITAFDIMVTVTNDVPGVSDWAPGDNSHDEQLATLEQYVGTLVQAKITAEFAIGLGGSVPVGSAYPPYRDTDPHIVALNHNELAWYCWTPDNDPDKRPYGAYFVPTWDLGDIPQGQSITIVMQFTVDGAGLPDTDLRYGAIMDSATDGTDILANRTTSLKVSTWIDDLYLDDGSAYPHEVDPPGLPLRSSDCSVFHLAEEQMEGGLSLDIRKPPFGGEVQPQPSWTGPGHDPHARRGQWFVDNRTMEVTTVRSHEYYDPVANDPATSLVIYGYVSNIKYDAVNPNNIIAFDIEATIYNGTPWPHDEWADGSNSHDEFLSTGNQYEGPLLDTILTADFAIKTIGMKPPDNAWLPYRQTDPYIYSLNEDWYAWYCWTPGSDKGPDGAYSVPGWNFGSIAQGGMACRTLKFGVFGNGLAPGDPRRDVIRNSQMTMSDVLLNRETSLKISTWVDDIYTDTGMAYPHEIDPGLPLRSSDCSVFHNAEGLEVPGGLSLDIRKPAFGGEVQPTPSWTGPMADTHAEQGQWFVDRQTLEIQAIRTHEYYDPVYEEPDSGISLDGSAAIYGYVPAASIQFDPASGNIVAFDIDATITNATPWPYPWQPGDNNHGETLNTLHQYQGPLLQVKLTGEFAIDAQVGPPPSNIAPYVDMVPDIIAQNHDQLAWYCWNEEHPDIGFPGFSPGFWFVPTWDFGDIPQGGSANRVLSFTVDGGGLLVGSPRYTAVMASSQQQMDILLNRERSLKISTWIDNLALDPHTMMPTDPPFRASDVSVFHNIEEEPEVGGLSLPITKGPVEQADGLTDQAFNGPPNYDPHAILGQWFSDADGPSFRTHEFYDPVPEDMPGLGAQAIYGRVVSGSIIYSALAQTITGFRMDVTITNLTPWPYTWRAGDNNHLETLNTADQYAGTLFDTKFAAEFAIDSAMGPPIPAVPPYFDIAPHIVAVDHDQLAWYCWTPENPLAEKTPWGRFQVPTWDFGDIPQGMSVTRTLAFTVDGGGLPNGDLRYQAIVDSEANGTDLLLNRTTSLKISTWIETLTKDTGIPYPHLVEDPPARSSDCSVFHNRVPTLQASATLDWQWVYQNTQTTTQDRHKMVCSVQIDAGELAGEVYDVVGVEEVIASIPGPLVNYQLFTPLPAAMGGGPPAQVALDLRGGRVGASTASCPNYHMLRITVAGQTQGQIAVCLVYPQLRRIGDINGDGSLTGLDRQLFNQRLNNVPTPFNDRHYDLDGSGGAPTGTDKQVMNQALNNIPLP